MSYGTLLTDTVQSSVSNTPPQFKDGSGTQVGTLCRAWVNFNGVTTPTATIRASFNVSSVTRNGTGDYTVNFTNSISDTNYAANVTTVARGGSGSPTSNFSMGYGSISTNMTSSTYTTSALRVYGNLTSGTAVDVDTVSVTIFR